MGDLGPRIIILSGVFFHFIIFSFEAGKAKGGVLGNALAGLGWLANLKG
jgi:hypothetical protein